MADHDDAAAGRLNLAEQEFEKRALQIAIERRCRLVGNNDFRPADQRAAATRCCCPTLSRDAAAPSSIREASSPSDRSSRCATA